MAAVESYIASLQPVGEDMVHVCTISRRRSDLATRLSASVCRFKDEHGSPPVPRNQGLRPQSQSTPSIFKPFLLYHDLSDVRTLESAFSLRNRILLLTQAPELLTSEPVRLSFRLAFATLERRECTDVDPSLLSYPSSSVIVDVSARDSDDETEHCSLDCTIRATSAAMS